MTEQSDNKPPITIPPEKINMDNIAYSVENDRYTFLAPTIETARRIVYDIATDMGADQTVIDRLRYPGIINDLRIDGIDTSYSENQTSDGDIEFIVYLRDYANIEPFSQNLKRAVNNLFEK